MVVGLYAVHDISDNKNPVLIHDHSFAVFHRGVLKIFLQLERLTRNKYDSRIQNYLEPIIRKIKLIHQLPESVVFVDHEVGRSFCSAGGQIRFEVNRAEELLPSLEKGSLFWFLRKTQGHALNHELAHLYSCIPFFGQFKENSLLIHFDGGASQSNFSAWIFRKGQPELLEYHYKLKRLTAFFNSNALVFAMVGANANNHMAAPGKFMGLAAYGKYSADIETWLQEHNYFEDCWSSKKAFFVALKQKFGIELNSIDPTKKIIQNIAATIHEVFIRESMKQILDLQQETQTDFLYFTGGCALNIKLNSCLVESGSFKEVYIPPCTNDTGLALGAAAFASEQSGNTIERVSPYLNNYDIEEYTDFSYTSDSIEEIALLLVKGAIIGICNGYGEIGPRALGNRSIIALADSKKLATKVSEECKGREWYRPIAPIMLEDQARYFTGLPAIHHLAKYMLLDFDILPDKMPELEGCVHIDGTSRIQVLFNRGENPFMYDLLNHLWNKYQVRALINTSFNVAGEPIVHTHKQALESGRKMKLDAVVTNGNITYF